MDDDGGDDDVLTTETKLYVLDDLAALCVSHSRWHDCRASGNNLVALFVSLLLFCCREMHSQ
jgi:hypothetical protein